MLLCRSCVAEVVAEGDLFLGGRVCVSVCVTPCLLIQWVHLLSLIALSCNKAGRGHHGKVFLSSTDLGQVFVYMLTLAYTSLPLQ